MSIFSIRIVQVLLIFLLVVFGPSVLAQAPDPDFNDRIAIDEVRHYQKSARFVESDDYAATDVTYQRLDFKVDPAVNFISGSVFSIVRFLHDDVSAIRFDLMAGLVVDSVKYNQNKAAFQHSANKISITLPSSAKKNTTGSVEVFYHGVPPQTGMGSFIVSKHNNVPVLWTLSEPYGARDWWPCKESLSDKIDSIDVFITCPGQYRAASNGKLISDEVSGSKRTAHWKHRYPIATYLVAIAVTNYEIYSETIDLPDGQKLELLNYIYPEYLATAKSKSSETRDIMNFYCRKFIAYPFASEKYGHAQFGWGGGMEHQTMSFMTNLDFELVAHEMAHQWFGDYITLASWHDIWLNEGFATYLTGLVYENLQNGVWWPNWKTNQITRIVSSAGGSVYVADTTDVNRIFNGRLSYSKGAYLLHMLRWEIGDGAFFKGLKNYLTDPKIANGFASQSQFVTHMETAVDTSLTEFFKDWYYGEGYPIFTLTYFPDPVNPTRQKVRISQSQSHPSVGFFDCTVPVRIWKGDKSKDLRLKLSASNQEFDLADEPFDRLEFDPDKWLIAKLDKIMAANPEMIVPGIRIIPDLAQHKIRIILPELKGNEAMQLFDGAGKMVMTQKLKNTDSLMDIGSLTYGLYLLKVQSGQTQKMEKIVVN